MSRGSTRVYVGKLSSRTRESDVYDAFNYFGRVNHIDMKNGFAFIEFDDARDADDAVYDMHNRELNGSRIIVEFAKGSRDRRDRGPPRGYGGGGGGGGRSRFGGGAGGPPQRSEYRVTVEGLPRDMSWQDLKDLFREHCDVIYTDVFTDRDGRPKGVAEFRSKDDLKRAIQHVDDKEVRGGRIIVTEDRGRSKSRSASRSPRRSRSPSRRSRSPSRRSRSPRRSASPSRRSRSPKGSRSPARSKSPRGRSGSPSKKSASRSPRRSPRDDSPAKRDRSPSRDDAAAEDGKDERDNKRRREDSAPRSPAD